MLWVNANKCKSNYRIIISGSDSSRTSHRIWNEFMEGKMPTTELMTVVTIFDRLLSAIGLIKEKQKERSERVDQALYALYAALNETKSYVSFLNSGKENK